MRKPTPTQWQAQRSKETMVKSNIGVAATGATSTWNYQPCILAGITDSLIAGVARDNLVK